jgi:hypothetical protein
VVIALGNATYVPMSVMARRMSRVARRARSRPARPSTPARRCSMPPNGWRRCCPTGPTRRPAKLFADNVALDESFARRARQAVEFSRDTRQRRGRSITAITPDARPRHTASRRRHRAALRPRTVAAESASTSALPRWPRVGIRPITPYPEQVCISSVRGRV